MDTSIRVDKFESAEFLAFRATDPVTGHYGTGDTAAEAMEELQMKLATVPESTESTE